MNACPDTSFLCALYRIQNNTQEAVRHRASIKGPLPVTALVLFEFRQSVRWQTWLHKKDTTKGYGEREGARMLADFQGDIDAGLSELVEVDWANVISIAEQLSSQHTGKGGHRGFDVLHVASAIALGAKTILTFDANQRKLAQAGGLKVKP